MAQFCFCLVFCFLMQNAISGVKQWRWGFYFEKLQPEIAFLCRRDSNSSVTTRCRCTASLRGTIVTETTTHCSKYTRSCFSFACEWCLNGNITFWIRIRLTEAKLVACYLASLNETPPVPWNTTQRVEHLWESTVSKASDMCVLAGVVLCTVKCFVYFVQPLHLCLPAASGNVSAC